PGYIYNRTYILLTSTNLTATYRYPEVVATIPHSRFDINDNYLEVRDTLVDKRCQRQREARPR
ncbi:MAG: hypothetical protein QXO48_06935, partial [Desulfurococcaceae archaeon]